MSRPAKWRPANVDRMMPACIESGPEPLFARLCNLAMEPKMTLPRLVERPKVLIQPHPADDLKWLWDTLSPEPDRERSDLGSIQHFAAGDVLVEERSHSDRVGFIVSGLVL